MDTERVEYEMRCLSEGIRLLLVNEFRAAEETFKEGAHRQPPPPEQMKASGPGSASSKDSRGYFALVWTLVSLMFGLLSFANDQLDECLQRVQMAEALLLQDAQWVGQRMLLAMVYTIAGVVHAAKNAWIKAGINFVRATRYIREFADGLTYQGPEQSLVRSTALFVLGLFNLVLSMLPPSLLGLASRAGGESLQGSQAEALRLLTLCQTEEGIMAPFAAVVLLCHYISIKTYLGEESGPEDVATSKALLAWAMDKYPGSAVFEFWQTELHASLQEIREASECVEHVHEALAYLELPAINSFLEQKKAYLNIAMLKWRVAAEGCERSLAVSVARNRRSYVPFLSYLAGLARLLDGDKEASKANFDRVTKYSKLRKWNWPPEDDLAFQKVKGYASLPSFGPFCALLDVVEVSMLKLHLLHTMPDDVKQRLRALLEDEAWCSELPAACRGGGSPKMQVAQPEETARAFLFRAELARLLKEDSEAKSLALSGLELVPRLGPRGASNGTAAQLHLTLAILGEHDHLKALERCPKPCRAYDEALKFKKLGVGKRADSGGGQAACEEQLLQERQGQSGHGDRGAADVGDDGALEDDWPEEFFSAEEDNEEPVPATSSGAEAPRASGQLDADASLEPAVADLVGSEARERRAHFGWRLDERSLALGRDWASKSAAKAWRSVSKAVHAVGNSVLELPSPAGGGSHSSPSSALLHLEALEQQADQGDCSIVSMPAPRRGASRDEVVAYLRWAQWSSLRGMSRQEALRQHADLVRSPGALRDAAVLPAAAEASAGEQSLPS